MNAVQQSAKLAHKGDYAAARMYNLSHKKVLSRAAKTETQQRQYKLWAHEGRQFESEMNEVQRMESDDMLENDAEEDEEEVSYEKEKKEEKMKKKEEAAKVLFFVCHTTFLSNNNQHW